MAPLAIDLFCGLGGWTDGLLAEGWDVIGFDIERHTYGDHEYPAQLVLQDVRTIHGSQFRNASLIVASSPCQEFSYRAMPWSRAKALGPPLLGMELFAQAERIQREAIEASGRFIPMVQENVRGAQKYIGRARWHYGSYYLWGDVPALMPITSRKDAIKVEFEERATKNRGGWFHDATEHPMRRTSSRSPARKAASALIAKIPFTLARHIARAWKPSEQLINYHGGENAREPESPFNFPIPSATPRD